MTERPAGAYPCGACRMPLRPRRWHPYVVCAWRCWRYYRRTGLDPVSRWLLERTPPQQITIFVPAAVADPKADPDPQEHP